MPSKKSNFQLYADECFPLTTAIYLRSLGYSIKHASELNFLNKSDSAHLKFAKKLKKTLITLDRDFLGYTVIKAEQSMGILVISTGSNAPRHINLICGKQLKKLTKNYVNGSLVLITNEKISRRSTLD